MTTAAPLTFGRYELVEKLATGGMAELYRARVVGAHGFQKPLVIKRILPHLASDDAFVSMFIDEAKITATLNHPKIVQVHELGSANEELFIVMEYVDGVDLLTLIKKCKAEEDTLPAELAVHIVHEVLDALDYAHHAHAPDGQPLDVVHRDISPGNILVSWRGDVKLADFGIARAVQRQHQTRTGTLKGKYGYMSPEQIAGRQIDGRSDLFSVGVVLAELLMFRRMFTAPSDLEVLLMVRDAKLDRLDKHGGHIAPALREIIAKALAREPEQRYQSAGAFRDALADWLYAAGKRLGARSVASFLQELHHTPSQRLRTRLARDAAFARTEFVDVQTISGTTTKARKLEAEDAARVGRALFDAGADAVVEARGPGDRPVASEPVPTPIPAEDSGVIDLPDLDDMSIDIDIDDEPASAASAAAATATPVGAAPAAIRAPTEAPDNEGDFAITTPLALFHRIAGYQMDGLLWVERGGAVKEAYFEDGKPLFVRSNIGEERLGEYLVRQKVLTRAQLTRALGVLPHFGGRLGNALVQLELMKPLDAFRHLSAQVRDKLVDVCTWRSGRYAWYSRKQNPWPALPLHLDTYDIMGAGAARLDAEHVADWARTIANFRPQRAQLTTVEPTAFGLGSRVGWVAERCDGSACVREMVGWFSAHDRVDFLRVLYLLAQTDAVRLK